MRRIRWIAFALIGALAACDSPAEPEDHAAGVVLVRADGSEAARFMLAPEVVTGSLAVRAGQSATYRVRVLTESGGTVAVDGLEYSIDNPVVVIGLAANIAIQAQDQIVVTGVDAGVTGRSTTIQFDLDHAGHDEFRVRGIPLTVQLP